MCVCVFVNVLACGLISSLGGVGGGGVGGQFALNVRMRREEENLVQLLLKPMTCVSSSECCCKVRTGVDLHAGPGTQLHHEESIR